MDMNYKIVAGAAVGLGALWAWAKFRRSVQIIDLDNYEHGDRIEVDGVAFFLDRHTKPPTLVHYKEWLSGDYHRSKGIIDVDYE